MPLQALALSVARWCTVEGSNPRGARHIAYICSEPMASVPGKNGDALQLSPTPHSHQSVFHWVDPRSYDIRLPEDTSGLLVTSSWNTCSLSILFPPCQGDGNRTTAIPIFGHTRA
jgi:hypothetical protein